MAEAKKELAELKVAAKSNPSSVAGAIAKNLNEGKEVHLTAVGAGAVNQGVKAIAIARGFVAPQGLNLATIPAFEDTQIDGEDRTAMNLRVILI